MRIWKNGGDTLESQMRRCCFEKKCVRKESTRDLEIESIFTGVALQINQSNKRRVFLCSENYKLTMRHVQYPYGEHNRFSAADIDRARARETLNVHLQLNEGTRREAWSARALGKKIANSIRQSCSFCVFLPRASIQSALLKDRIENLITVPFSRSAIL